MAFGSRSCTDTERAFHSFVGETACGRWSISQNRRFLWGNHFYWMCDCSAVKQEVLEYNGSISFVLWWAQELLCYNFTVVHRSAHMMVDVDGLSRRPLITPHCLVALILSSKDRTNRPKAYDRYSVPIIQYALKTPSPPVLSSPALTPPHNSISTTPTI